jgi:hypothetical protein
MMQTGPRSGCSAKSLPLGLGGVRPGHVRLRPNTGGRPQAMIGACRDAVVKWQSLRSWI